MERVVAWILRAWSATWRVRRDGALPAGAAVVGCWHGDAVVLGALHRNEGLVVLVSLSDDGRRGAALLSVLGYDVVRGSGSRGAVRASREALRAVRSGRKVVVAMDGPRGPAGEAKPGAVALARLAGVPFVRCTLRADGPRLPTWDRTLLPWPFASIDLRYAVSLPDGEDARG